MAFWALSLWLCIDLINCEDMTANQTILSVILAQETRSILEGGDRALQRLQRTHLAEI